MEQDSANLVIYPYNILDGNNYCVGDAGDVIYRVVCLRIVFRPALEADQTKNPHIIQFGTEYGNRHGVKLEKNKVAVFNKIGVGENKILTSRKILMDGNAWHTLELYSGEAGGCHIYLNKEILYRLSPEESAREDPDKPMVTHIGGEGFFALPKATSFVGLMQISNVEYYDSSVPRVIPGLIDKNVHLTGEEEAFANFVAENSTPRTILEIARKDTVMRSFLHSWEEAECSWEEFLRRAIFYLNTKCRGGEV